MMKISIPKKTTRTIEQAMEAAWIELQLFKQGRSTLAEYEDRMGMWMRILADNAGAERGSWEIPA